MKNRLFSTFKHDLEKKGVFILDRAISNASANDTQFYRYLQQLIYDNNPECHAEFYDVETGKLLTECVKQKEYKSLPTGFEPVLTP